jgi:hydrogenase expression/formation protein HypC
MCHAVPAQVTDVLPGEMAQVDLAGAKKTVSTALVGAVAVGDFLLVHVGYALGRVDPTEAAATLKALEDIGASQ